MARKIFITIFFIFFITLKINADDEFPRGKVAATVNGEIISQKELMQFLEKSCGEEEAEGLRMNVVRHYLEEMIIFKIIELKLSKINISITRDEWLEDVERFEKSFFAYYQEEGLSSESLITFIKSIREVVSKVGDLEKKYGTFLEDMSARPMINLKDRESI